MIERRRVYRGKIMPVAGWLLAVAPLGVWVLWLVYNDGSADSLVCPLAVSWLPFVAGFGLIRPRLIAGADGITVVEPLGKTVVPWSDIRRFDSLEVLYVHRRNGLPSIRVAALATSNPRRLMGKPGHADHVARELNALLADHHGGRSPRITADSAKGRRRLRLTPWYSAYPISGLLLLSAHRWGLYWIIPVAVALPIAATLALRKYRSEQG